jgi:hypothetical protein
MTFVHGYLLFGLALAAVPVVLHLLQRQQPKALDFPALRFLRARHRSTTRKLKLRHLLLLLLRVGLLAFLCLALAKPLLSLGGNAGAPGQAVAAALVVDTSLSMELNPGDQTRLDAARRRAREALDDLAPNSLVAVLDSGDPAEVGFATSPDDARNRLAALRPRAANAPVNRQLERAYRLLQGPDVPGNLPRVVYVFSDRTRECWDATRSRASKPPEGVAVVFVDVGEEQPRDLAIDRVELVPPVAAAGELVRIRVTVRATGADLDCELICQVGKDGDPDRGIYKGSVHVGAGREEVVVFRHKAPELPKDGGDLPQQVSVRLATNDALPFNNTRFATFLVRRPRLVLTLADSPKAARLWKAALESWKASEPGEAFDCRVVPIAEWDRATENLRPETVKVVTLFETAHPPLPLWVRLARYVREGGGLILIPGGEEAEADRERYAQDATDNGLLPAQPVKLVTVPLKEHAVGWAGLDERHPLAQVYLQYDRPAVRPAVSRHWLVDPVRRDDKEGVASAVIASYAGKEGGPALVERRLGKGKVVQLTVPLSGRELADRRPWHNYWSGSSFGVQLAHECCRHLAGGVAAVDLNFVCGQVPSVTLAGAVGPLTLDGPGLTASEKTMAAKDGRLTLPQATTPGNFLVLGAGADKRVLAGFSVNAPAEEGRLERVPKEDIEAVLGPASVATVPRKVPLRQALPGATEPPHELLPYLLLLVVLLIAGEGVLANRFYRPAADEEEAPPGRERLARAAAGSVVGLLAGALLGAVAGMTLAGLRGGPLWPQTTAWALPAGLAGALAGLITGGRLTPRQAALAGAPWLAVVALLALPAKVGVALALVLGALAGAAFGPVVAAVALARPWQPGGPKREEAARRPAA